LRLPQISRLPLRSLLRGRHPARHPPLLQWPHQKPLPICPRQGRAERGHKGLCRPREARPTRQLHRAQFGSLSLSPLGRRPVEPTTTTDTTRPFSRPSQRKVTKNLLGEPVVAISLRRRKGSVHVKDGSPAGLRMVYRPSLSCPVGVYSTWEDRTLEAHRVERKLAAIFAADVEATAVSWAEMRSVPFARSPRTGSSSIA
jgi:hypothetical protein